MTLYKTVDRVVDDKIPASSTHTRLAFGFSDDSKDIEGNGVVPTCRGLIICRLKIFNEENTNCNIVINGKAAPKTVMEHSA